MNTNKIIDACLRGIGEPDPANPVEMTRAEVMDLVNAIYQNEIGKRVKNLASFSYDGSDPAHTITAGVGPLPTDFLEVSQVYNGDAPGQYPLDQIFKIADKVADDAICSQYMLPDNANLWVFGKTPAIGIKLYYYRKPVVLTDNALTSPVDLKEEFHRDIFVARVKEVYAENTNNTYDMMDQRAKIEDLLTLIEQAHNNEKRDDTPRTIQNIYGGLC